MDTNGEYSLNRQTVGEENPITNRIDSIFLRENINRFSEQLFLENIQQFSRYTFFQELHCNTFKKKKKTYNSEQFVDQICQVKKKNKIKQFVKQEISQSYKRHFVF